MFCEVLEQSFEHNQLIETWPTHEILSHFDIRTNPLLGFLVSDQSLKNIRIALNGSALGQITLKAAIVLADDRLNNGEHAGNLQLGGVSRESLEEIEKLVVIELSPAQGFEYFEHSLDLIVVNAKRID